jgi:hypothetical protein
MGARPPKPIAGFMYDSTCCQVFDPWHQNATVDDTNGSSGRKEIAMKKHERTIGESNVNFYRGVKLLHDPVRNKGTAFTEQERDELGLRGLLPPKVCTQDEQVMRVLDNLQRKFSDLVRYVYLIALQDRNETLFYRIVTEHLQAMMPLIYTPTVGKASQLYGHIFRRPRGLFLTANDKGRMSEVLGNWPHRDVRIIVITDGLNRLSKMYSYNSRPPNGNRLMKGHLKKRFFPEFSGKDLDKAQAFHSRRVFAACSFQSF